MFIPCLRHQVVIARHILSRTVVSSETHLRNQSKDVVCRFSFSRLLYSRKLEPVCTNVLNIQLQITRNAGHSHWQNIRHTKGAKDLEKQRTTNYLLMKLKNAVRDGGSCDPALNSKVASALEEGRTKGIPKATLTEYLRKLDDKSNFKTHTIEAKGPGQSLFIFEVLTDKPVAFESQLRPVFKKNQGRVGTKKGFASFGFNHRGYITVKAAEVLTLDEMTDIAIECEAEEVEEITEDEEPLFQLSCPAEDLFKVKGKLEKSGMVTVKKAYAIWEPKSRVSLTAPDNELLDRIYNKLDQIEGIEEIYDNLEISLDDD